MILSEIKRYMKQRRSANLAEIALHFKSEPSAVQGMLEQWIRKGKMSRRQASEECGSCCKCNATATEIYEWLEP